MNKIKIVTALAGWMFLHMLAGCSTPAYVQKDESVNLSDFRTYMWFDTRASENDESKRATAYADISVRNAVNAELASWGWKEVTENPDVLIGYDVFVERTSQTQRDPVYSQPFTRYYYNPYRRRWSTIYYPSQFQGYEVYETPVKEGTITITMVDAKTDKNVWQGWTTERLASSTLTDAEIRKSVRNIFRENRS
jgi:hypothetical protein